MQTLLKNIYIFLICIALSPLTAFAIVPTYTSSEHLTAGNNIKVYFNKNDSGKNEYIFSFPNALSLSYGDIVTFGDFYGDPDKAISLGESKEEREKRFLFAFNMFTVNTDSVEEANKIMDVIHNEQQYVLIAINNGEQPEAVYARISDETSRKLNCITGGGCDEKTWWLTSGRYLKLAEYNYDHFGENTLIAYQAGHDVAIRQAIAAGKNHDKKALEIAYAMNAFAQHFLSDRFASGHIRTPRKELNDHVTPEKVGATLAGYMHNEENEHGLHVHNNRGIGWISYGDNSYLSDRNDINRYMLNEALQTSTNHIFNAYLTGSASVDSTMNIIPYADETSPNTSQDISQLFYFDSSKNVLMRRADMNNVDDKNWISNWWGWTTLIELRNQRGMPIALQRQLALSHYKDRAIQDGLITDKDILNVVK